LTCQPNERLLLHLLAPEFRHIWESLLFLKPHLSPVS
jgi:hypothetical protein